MAFGYFHANVNFGNDDVEIPVNRTIKIQCHNRSTFLSKSYVVTVCSRKKNTTKDASKPGHASLVIVIGNCLAKHCCFLTNARARITCDYKVDREQIVSKRFIKKTFAKWQFK